MRRLRGGIFTAIAATAFILTGCAHYQPNPQLAAIDTQAGYRYRAWALTKNEPPPLIKTEPVGARREVV